MTPSTSATILLASGRSERFGPDDKLLATLNGRPLGSYAASLMQAERSPLHCAILPHNMPDRTALFREAGWHILTNPAPENGQGTSLAIAAKHLLITEATSALILLADMPFVSEGYVRALIDKAPTDHAVMSQNGDILQPPALFPRSTFAQLASATGDTGARKIFNTLPNTATHPISLGMARDIDTQAALISAQESPLHV